MTGAKASAAHPEEIQPGGHGPARVIVLVPFHRPQAFAIFLVHQSSDVPSGDVEHLQPDPGAHGNLEPDVRAALERVGFDRPQRECPHGPHGVHPENRVACRRRFRTQGARQRHVAHGRPIVSFVAGLDGVVHQTAAVRDRMGELLGRSAREWRTRRDLDRVRERGRGHRGRGRAEIVRGSSTGN